MQTANLDCDYLIIGAGLMGSSVAMHLAEFLQGKDASIVVLDADLEGRLSSSELNAGGARATWEQSINVELSQHSLDFFQAHQKEVGFHPCGYLWMFAPEKWEAAQARARQLQKYQLNVETLSVSELQARAPFIDKVDGVAGATFSPRDGLFNPNLLKIFFRDLARRRGVKFAEGHRVLRVDSLSGNAWKVECNVTSPEEEAIKKFLAGDSGAAKQGVSASIHTKILVNCTGAWASRLARIIGYETYTWPVRRQVSVFSCREVDLRKNGMIVDTSGVYFHPEADNILGGYADPAEPRGYNLNYDGMNFFEEKIWMPLYERSSYFASLKHITGWAGLYEMTPDCSGIIGSAPGVKGVYECHGFSGRGAMQSFAAGRGLAELIAFGKYQTINLHSLTGERFQTKQFVPEGLHI